MQEYQGTTAKNANQRHHNSSSPHNIHTYVMKPGNFSLILIAAPLKALTTRMLLRILLTMVHLVPSKRTP